MSYEGVSIDHVQSGAPFAECEEYVSIFNGSKHRFDLKGWRLVYSNAASGELLHTHYFYVLKGSFDPGERLCVISSNGRDRFRHRGDEPKFPGPHWDLFTDHPLHLLDLPCIRVQLLDEESRVIDTLRVERIQEGSEPANAIKIFVGHGHDPQWRELKDHLQDQHRFVVVAYEIGPRAGLGVKDVLEKMLRESSFALLVLTGEDIDTEGEAHARENVVHELGLFQGRLGFTRAIALVENGVKEFSNIHGVNQIRFPKAGIREVFGDVVATIHREFG